MTNLRALVIRDVEVDGRPGLDVRIEDGRIAEIGPRLGRAQEDLDGRGGALVPGLVDHHIHLLGLAAKADSIDLHGVRNRAQFEARVAEGLSGRPAGAWARAVGYHETMAGDLNRRELDKVAPHHRLRVQHQTGSLWILNGRALEAVSGNNEPPGLERDSDGHATGRLWRGDAWLRERVGAGPPPLAPVGRELATFGVTALTDASVTTDASAAALLADAARTRALPQRLTLMSGGELAAPEDGAFAVGPVKVLLDEHDLPDLDDFTRRVAQARAWGRNVAVHCVTAAELALTLAAFEAAGAGPGDRVEHGGVIPESAIGRLRDLRLTVVTQPAFIRERGDRYAVDVAAHEQADLYRCATLVAAGVPVASSSDAPYASPDPWLGVAAAVDRRTRSGLVLSPAERIAPAAALGLYMDDPARPGRAPRRVAAGAPADLCLLKTGLRAALEAPDAELVGATLIGGEAAYLAAGWG